MLDYYKEILGYNEMPNFLLKYLNCPSLIRLKKIGYFCGMDYASSDIYNFPEYISRYDHSLTVALLVYKLTKNKVCTVAGLLHDISSPCFSHVIDYMNKDYEKQESTEIYTEKIILNDQKLCACLKKDGIELKDAINFKKYSIVDNERPHVCADRLDGIILTSIGWIKNITKEDIFNIVNNSVVLDKNGFKEIAFTLDTVATKVIFLNEEINYHCHAAYDNYMMELLANITRLSIEYGYFTYYQLYQYTEDEIFKILNEINDDQIKKLLQEFRTIKLENIPDIKLENVKVRKIKPLIIEKNS